MPQVTFDVQDEHIVESRGAMVSIEVDKLHDNSLARIFIYGLEQIIADSASAAAALAKTEGKDVAEITGAMMEKKVAALYDGTLRIASTRAGDPVLREFLGIVVPKVRAKYKTEGYKLHGKGDDVVSATQVREAALKFGGDRNAPPSDSAKKAWELARKRVEETTFEL